MTPHKKAYMKEYYLKNIGYLKEYGKKYAQEYAKKYPQKIYAVKKEYRKRNKTRILKSKKEYYLKNREYLLKQQEGYRLERRSIILSKKCRWCTTILVLNRTKFCSSSCDDKYQYYKKRYLPIFFWRFYSNHRLYLFITSYPKKFKKLIFKTFPKKILRFLYIQGHRKLKYIILDLRQYRLRITKQCRHLIIYKMDRRYKYKSHYRRNFCSAQCRLKYKADIKERKKVRSLVSWGTRERPDKETRRIIRNKKWLIYNKKRRKIDPAYKLITRMRAKTKQVLKKNPAYRRTTNGIKLSIYETLCIKDGKELKRHFESLWESGMTWDNYGTGKEGWVSDHIIPLKYFMKNYDLVNDMEARKKAFGKQNLQPLWWLDNARKAAKLNYIKKGAR